MDGEAGGHVQREKKRSYSHVRMDEDELQEADSDFEKCFRRLHKVDYTGI